MKKDWSQFNILIVEDDLSLLEVLSDYFKRYGAKTSEARNGKEALAIVANEKIDFICAMPFTTRFNGATRLYY